ncbi:MAG: hypothetical protein S4CHLAM45_05420 [Chlamydiales bacterium]|nr:hypothetical protein [Chlamydiales bacterium]MCH9619917.1 hypothetical protein [Chlamydiales bacterium]MCH9622656.1 hypothetical protein [Chlamydiales bacterium]
MMATVAPSAKQNTPISQEKIREIEHLFTENYYFNTIVHPLIEKIKQGKEVNNDILFTHLKIAANNNPKLSSTIDQLFQSHL